MEKLSNLPSVIWIPGRTETQVCWISPLCSTTSQILGSPLWARILCVWHTPREKSWFSAWGMSGFATSVLWLRLSLSISASLPLEVEFWPIFWPAEGVGLGLSALCSPSGPSQAAELCIRNTSYNHTVSALREVNLINPTPKLIEPVYNDA